MKTIMWSYSSLIVSLAIALLLLSPHAFPLPPENGGCTVVQLEEVSEATLTTAERIARMEQSLQDSIDQHDSCIEQSVSANAGQSSHGMSGEAGGDGENIGNTDLDNEERDGTEQAPKLDEASDDSQQAQNTLNRRPENNGAKNQTIAPKNNDAAICVMLSEELHREKDVQKQKELKAIYKNYRCR